ncbi:hypothetical protein BGX23_004693 [Mortierella sp. AD031]|nr:hypothetical protein BGX23_004693 [Mortierella sp. AD031]
MASSGKDSTGSASKDALDLYDGEDDMLDYGDDLEADLLDGDLAAVGVYDDLEDDLGLDLPLDASSTTLSSTTSSKTEHNGKSAVQESDDTIPALDALDGTDETAYPDEQDAFTAAGESKTSTRNQFDSSSSSKNQRDAPSAQYDDSEEHSEVDLGGINRQNTSGQQSSYTNTSTRGGARGRLRGRGGQGYMSTGRGNYQGGAGRGYNQMAGMGANQYMYPGMPMGMSTNMGMGMNSMAMNGGHYPSGNQGMTYPYNGGAGMGGMSVQGSQGGMGTPGRTIHINPKFQGRPGVPTIPGVTLDRALGQQTSYSQQQQQNSRQSYRDSGNGQTQARGNQSMRSGSQDKYDGYNRNQQYNNGRGEMADGRDQTDGSGSERGRNSDRSARSPSGDSARNPQSYSPSSGYNRSPVVGSASPGSISGRLTPGLKRPGGAMEDSQKAHKSSGGSTPRSEQNRPNNQGYGSDTGSVSFLRDRRGTEDDTPQQQNQHEPSSNAVPTGFVKIDNIPESLSDASIRQLAHGISGVDRVLTVSKKGDRTVVLGFGSVDEAKFFRRQINRTTVEGSLVTVTLTSA